MTRATKRLATAGKVWRDEQAPLFFEQGPHSLLRRWLALAIAAAAIVGAIWLLEGEGPANPLTDTNSVSAYDITGKPYAVPVTPGEGPQAGKPAPDFALLDLQGKEWRLSSLKGRAIVLNFWATWCPPCRAEMPDLDALSQKYKDAEVLVLGVNLREDASAVSRFAKILSLSFPLLLDPQGYAVAQYHIVALPTTFFIDRNGILREINIGALGDRALEAKLQKARE